MQNRNQDNDGRGPISNMKMEIEIQINHEIVEMGT